MRAEQFPVYPVTFLSERILPSQFFARDQSRHLPDLRLRYAVIEEALQCLHAYGPIPHARARRLYIEARAWFLDPDDSWIMAFARVAEHFDIDVSAARAQIAYQFPDLPPIALNLPGPKKPRAKRFVRLSNVECRTLLPHSAIIRIEGMLMRIGLASVHTDSTPMLRPGQVGDLVVNQHWCWKHSIRGEPITELPLQREEREAA